MKKAFALILILVMGMTVLAGCSKKVDQFSDPKAGETVAEIYIQGYKSPISIKFFKDAAPKAVENFVTHSKDGYYNGLSFHRIINDFMIQGGDPTGTGAGGESIWGDNFEDEISDNLQLCRGALCMANSGANTNGSQFFIIQAKDTYDADTLKQIETQYGIKFNDDAIKKFGEVGGTPWLYQQHTVFGQVYGGYDVLDAVAAVETDSNDKPVTDVLIDKIDIIEYKK